MSARRWLAIAAYIPLVAALGWMTAVCLLLLLRREPAGLYAVPYGLGAAWMTARAARLKRPREEDEDPPTLEIALALTADALLAGVLAVV